MAKEVGRMDPKEQGYAGCAHLCPGQETQPPQVKNPMSVFFLEPKQGDLPRFVLIYTKYGIFLKVKFVIIVLRKVYVCMWAEGMAEKNGANVKPGGRSKIYKDCVL